MEFAQQLLNGLAVGSIYALLALGLAIVFSILRLVNFAHGELITLSAYAMFGLASLGLPWPILAAAAVITAALAAMAMERIAFRPVRSANPQVVVVTSLGLALIIQTLLASLISPRPRAVPQPEWIAASWEFVGLRFQAHQVLTLAVTGLALALLAAFFRRSTVGLSMRAATDDFDAARLSGVRANAVILTAFAIAGSLAGVAGVLFMARRGLASPTMGLSLVLKAFVANVVGGLGSLTGPVVAGFVIGAVEVAFRAWLPQTLAGFADGFIFAVVALLLLVRPSGLAPAHAGVG